MNAQTEHNIGWRLLIGASLFLVLSAFLGDKAIGQLVDVTNQGLTPVSSVEMTDGVEPAHCA